MEERSRTKEREKGEKRHRGSGKGQRHGGGGCGGVHRTARIRRVSTQTVCQTKPWRRVIEVSKPLSNSAIVVQGLLRT